MVAPSQRDALRGFGKVARDSDGTPLYDEPLVLFVEAGMDGVHTAIGQGGFCAAEADQPAVPIEPFAVRRARWLRPVQPRVFDGLARLRIGYLVEFPSKRREFLAATLAYRTGEVGLAVIGEILKGRRGAPFFALKQHRHKRGSEDERGADFQPAVTDELAHAFALGAVAYLIVILKIAEKGVTAQTDRQPPGHLRIPEFTFG